MRVINASFGAEKSEFAREITVALSQFLPQNILLVWAAGNKRKGVDVYGEVPVLIARGYTNFLRVGNLRGDFSMAPSSNTAGRDPGLYEHFICEIGSGMLAATSHGQHEISRDGGTSSAAPIVTGLVARLYADFSTLDMCAVRRVLVGTAHKDFFRGTGCQGDFTYYKNRRPTLGHPEVDYSVCAEQFDPTIYGSGILNGRDAYHVCQYLAEHGGEVDDAAQDYWRFVIVQEHASETIIHRCFRAYQQKKRDYGLKAWGGVDILWEKRQAYWLARLGVVQRLKAFKYLLARYYYNTEFVTAFMDEFLKLHTVYNPGILRRILVRYMRYPKEIL